jgi:Zn-dependent protease with chaperone function
MATAVTLSCFAMMTTLASMALAIVGPAVARRVARYSPRARATILFQLRVAPTALALTCALGLALPVFLWFEPAEGNERVAVTMILAAAAGAAVLLRSAWRVGSSWRATAAVLRNWRAQGRRVDMAAPMPVFAVDDSFPTVAVVGFSRPALFIAERVLEACSAGEVRAMVLHECAHVAHRDNLKRLLIRACADPLRSSGRLDGAWARASEEAADASAAAANPAHALDLAQALIRVARLAPRASTLQVASAFYLGGSIESRVRQLVEPASSVPDPSRPLGCVVAGATLCAMGAFVILAAPAIHQVIEAVVRGLP